MSNIPKNLYRAEQVQALDRLAIEQHDIAGMTLMERAGMAAFDCLRWHWPRTRRIGILCGVGNNGGDGYVIARLAAAAGMRVIVYQVGDHSRLKGDALTAFERLEGSQVEIHPFDEGHTLDLVDVVIDSMLGTGVKGEVKGQWRTAIDAVNAFKPEKVKVLAIDVPSGLDANTGQILGAAVNADVTISFIGMKQGLLTGSGPEMCGELIHDDLNVPEQIYHETTASARLLAIDDYCQHLKPRARDSHKGKFGHVLVIGGNIGMSGAVRLAGEAALRCGAGLVSVATRAQHALTINQARPELMCHGVDDAQSLTPLLAKASVIVIGPGLGQDQWARTLMDKVLESSLPAIIDADALNLLAKETSFNELWVLTPHPAEAARLLQTTTSKVQADRFAAAHKIQDQFKGICVLKGAGTIVASESAVPGVCANGNPGMASGGMGDVLSGVIASMFAQGLSLQIAAELGVCLHATAADRVAQNNGERGILASDLFVELQSLVN